MDRHDTGTQPLFLDPEEPPRSVSFDPTSWPYLVARTSGTVTVLEIRQLLARLEPWLVTTTSLLALWIDTSPEPCQWLDDEAAHSVGRWMTRHRADLYGRRVSIAFVSPHSWKRQYLEQRICRLESVHGVSLDVFAQESAARAWLRAHAVAVSVVGTKRSAVGR